MVQRDGLVDKLRVTADGTGVVGHAGSALLAGTADRIGLTRALSKAMKPTRQRASAHDPGVVLRDLAVMLADGGDCLADLGALRDQEDLFGGVASDSTAFRVIDSIDAACLERLRAAVATARACAWKLGARPQRIVLDVDATLTTAYSPKEHAAGNFKKGYGHHPLLCYLDGTGEGLAGILRAGNAGSNTAADHSAVIDLALGQLDSQALDGEILVRADGAGATHELTQYCHDAGMRFSFGFDLDQRVRDAICGLPESGWIKAIRVDHTERKHSQVAEITGRVDLSTWPPGSRLIARRTELTAGDQQSFADQDGYRLSVFLADAKGSVCELDLDHRGHAHVEGHIRQAKDCGLANLPFQSFAHNQAWLWLVMLAQDIVAFTQALCLADDARAWELKRLRYRLLHQSARIARHARQTTLRLARDWPWSGQLASAFAPPSAARPDRRLTPPARPPDDHAARPTGVSLPANNARSPTRPAPAPRTRPRTPDRAPDHAQAASPALTTTPPNAYCKPSDSDLAARSRRMPFGPLVPWFACWRFPTDSRRRRLSRRPGSAR